MPANIEIADNDPANSAEAVSEANTLARRLMEQLTYTSEIAGLNTTIVSWLMIVELMSALAVHVGNDPDETLFVLRDRINRRISELRADLADGTIH